MDGPTIPLTRGVGSRATVTRRRDNSIILNWMRPLPRVAIFPLLTFPHYGVVPVYTAVSGIPARLATFFSKVGSTGDHFAVETLRQFEQSTTLS